MASHSDSPTPAQSTAEGLPARVRPALSLAVLVLPVLVAIGSVWLVTDEVRKSNQTTSLSQSIRDPPAGYEERNSRRLADLVAIERALIEYAGANGGAYPSTAGRTQTLCKFEQLDVGCRLKSVLPQLPSDPRPDLGYSYASDGMTFLVSASWEGPRDPPPEYRCPQGSMNAICRQSP